MEKLVKCPECKCSIKISCDLQNKKGLCYLFILECVHCEWSYNMDTSKQSDPREARQGRPNYEINTRVIIAFREIGRGFSAMETFCGFMNIPSPMSKSTFADKFSLLHDAYVSVSQTSMYNASLDVRKKIQGDGFKIDSPSDTDISVDGTWQRRGYASMNGVVTAISQENGKCIDVQVMSKMCKACQVWEKRDDPINYENFKVNHDCPINHVGSSGSMESKGAVEIFKRSLRVNNLRYKTYVGDGDTSSHQAVVDSRPYHNLVPEKAECIGHVQKRVGTRLRNLKATCKEKLSDGKTLGGRGRLTDKVINALQNSMGMAKRQNVGDLTGMKKGVGALLYHYSTSNDPDIRHIYCPRTEDSWCKYQSDKITGKDTYKLKINIPIVVRDKIKPIFMDLSKDELLKKCLHGRTQNANESINQLIWQKCPKSVYVQRFTLEAGVASAVINFNDGVSGIINVLEKVNVVPGDMLKLFCSKTDNNRIVATNKKTTPKVQMRRKKLRAIRKGYIDHENESEGITYQAGGF